MALAVSTALYDGYSMEEALANLAEAGIRRVEPAYIKGYVDFDEDAFSDRSAQSFASAMRGEGLSAKAVSAHMDLGAEGAVAMFMRRIRFAATLGARFLITNSTTRSRVAAFERALDAVRPLCLELDVVIALENPGHGKDDLFGTLAGGNAIVDRIGSDGLALNYDIGNVFTYSHGAVDPIDELSGDLRHVRHVHLKDIAVDGEDLRFTPIGAGDLDYGRIIERLTATGGIKDVSLELPLRLSRPGRSDPQRAETPRSLAEIRDALEVSLGFCRRYGLT